MMFSLNDFFFQLFVEFVSVFFNRFFQVYNFLGFESQLVFIVLL